MKIIKELSHMIEDELDDAEKYIKAAIRVKGDDPELGKLFFDLSREEMGHMERLHNAVVKMIKTYRDAHGDPPAGMMEFYNYLHEAHEERATRIQLYINRYSEK